MKMFRAVFLLAGCGLLGGLSGTAHAQQEQEQQRPPALHKACPMYVRLCPDGKHTSSASGPNCEFTPCPGEDGTATGGAEPVPAPMPAPPSSAHDSQGSTGGVSGYADGSSPELHAEIEDPPPADYPSPPGDNGEPLQSMPVMPVQNTP